MQPSFVATHTRYEAFFYLQGTVGQIKFIQRPGEKHLSEYDHERSPTINEGLQKIRGNKTMV